MELNKIEIVNYRSVANITIDTIPKCQGFVGINESGKTNVLTAISQLSPEIKLNKDDVRIEGTDEDHDQDSYIKYFFELSSLDMDEILDSFEEKIYSESTLPPVEIKSKKVDLREFFMARNTGLFYCNIAEERKYSRYYGINQSEDVGIDCLKKVKTSSTSTITMKSGTAVTLSKYNFVETECIPEDKMSFFEDCTLKDLNEVFGGFQKVFIEEHLPPVVYWKYDSKYLLPNRINLKSFRSDPSICLPLKSMFQLAGYTDIAEVLENIENERPNKITNILNNVSKKSSEYLRKVWKDYKNVSFELRINGENIDIHIKDANNFYDCEQRSDGFKRFVTFLLALSAPVNNGEISNAIIIIDEPDTGIHIKGQKNLMQELIRISKNNLVFYSTHSIFMIDREDPSRHFIVSKTNEVSKISQVTSSNYTDDEVLFNALGYSIFETLKPKNIIFEGWADKKLFITALASTKGKALTGLKDFGYVHASGVKTIIGVAKDLELANRAYVVISDSDGPAKQKRREYDEKEICTGEWYAYDELMPEIYTLEDFIKHSALKKAILKIAEKYPELQEFNVENIDGVKYKREERIKEGILAVIKDKQKCSDIMKEIKSEIYSNVTTRDIEDEYFEFLKALDEKIVPRD